MVASNEHLLLQPRLRVDELLFKSIIRGWEIKTRTGEISKAERKLELDFDTWSVEALTDRTAVIRLTPSEAELAVSAIRVSQAYASDYGIEVWDVSLRQRVAEELPVLEAFAAIGR